MFLSSPPDWMWQRSAPEQRTVNRATNTWFQVDTNQSQTTRHCADQARLIIIADTRHIASSIIRDSRVVWDVRVISQSLCEHMVERFNPIQCFLKIQNSSNNNNDAFDNPDCDQILTETLAPTQCVSRSHNSSQALGTRPSVLPGRAHMTWHIHQLPGRNSGCFRPTHWPLTIFTRRIIPTTSKVELNHHWAWS